MASENITTFQDYPYECVLEGEANQYWCILDFDSSKGTYRQAYELYYFKLESINEFGTLVQKFPVHNYESGK